MLNKSIISNLSNIYKNNGYVVIKNILNTKIKNDLIRYVNEIETDSKINKYLNQYELTNDYKTVLCRTEKIIDNHKGMENIINYGLIPDIVSKISNFPVNIYKEKINYKYPNTGGYRPHQDITAYPNSQNHTTCMISLCDTNLQNGCLEFSPLNNNVVLENKNGIILEEEKLDWISCPTNFGDIVLFNSYIPHRSGSNKMEKPRKALYLTYNNAEEGNLRDEYYKKKNQNIDDDKISLIDHYDGNVINEKNKKINSIINLYIEQGHKKYDSHITHLEHALQTTEIAKKNGESEEFQLACFFHDIGHLLLDENNSNNEFLKKDLKHETIGFKYLYKNFNKDITDPIMYHVLAKRYLCTIDNNYYESLSIASKKSFQIQGGKIDDDFLKKLENNDKFKNAVKLRKYEDISKIHNNINLTINIDYIKNLINKFIL